MLVGGLLVVVVVVTPPALLWRLSLSDTCQPTIARSIDNISDRDSAPSRRRILAT